MVALRGCTAGLVWGAIAVALIAAAPSAVARSIVQKPPANGNVEPPPKARTADFRPEVNWQLLCSGCHLSDARGVPALGVPRLKGFVGNFLKIDGGREYLVRVPGAAQSPLTDAQLAALMNWILTQRIAGASTPDDFQPYTAQEVGALRRQPLMRVNARRRTLLQRMAAQGIEVEAGRYPPQFRHTNFETAPNTP